MVRRRLIRALAAIALGVTAATLAFAAPAQAAVKPIGLSTDGVTYADNLPTSLFAGVLIVPGASVTRTFYVKNRTALPGNLALALKGVSGGDPNLIAALSIKAVAGSAAGPTAPFTSAAPCRSLVSGVALPGGAVLQVDIKLTLSNSLNHHTSQGSVGNFLLPVTLTSTDVAAPDGCGLSVPVTPPKPPVHTGDPVTQPPGTIDTVDISGAADGTVLPTLGDGPLSGLGGKGVVRGDIVLPNTGRFWQELDVVGYLIALILGGIFAWWWRRRRSDEEEEYA